MIADSSVPLHKATIARLKADAGVSSIVGDRVYDAVPGGDPNKAIKPYIRLGPFLVLPEEADCSEGVSVTIQIDGFTAGPDSIEAKRLGAAVGKAMQWAQMPLDDGQRLVICSVEMIQYVREPDNITGHAIITVRGQTEPLNT